MKNGGVGTHLLHVKFHYAAIKTVCSWWRKNRRENVMKKQKQPQTSAARGARRGAHALHQEEDDGVGTLRPDKPHVSDENGLRGSETRRQEPADATPEETRRNTSQSRLGELLLSES